MKQLLSLFNLRPIEHTLYKTLFNGGLMSASQLAKLISISRPSVYDLIARLINIGLVTETTQSGVKMFTVQSPKKIQFLIDEKQTMLNKADKELSYLKQIYNKNQKTKKPQLQLYEGQPALQQMMKDMLLYRDITVYVLWPIKKIISLLTPAFLEQFHQERISRNIKLKVIWPKKQIPTVKQFPFLKINSEYIREVRIAPNEIDFSLGYAIYGNTVRFISSSNENFGFLVTSPELADMMKSQYKIIWQASTKYQPK